MWKGILDILDDMSYAMNELQGWKAIGAALVISMIVAIIVCGIFVLIGHFKL